MKFRFALASILSVVLTSTTTSANAAEWMEVHDLGDRKLYLSFPPPNPTDKPLLVWSMLSFKQTQSADGNTWQSWVQLEEFDCKKRVKTLKKVVFYPKANAVGQPVQTIEPNQTEPIQPATLGEIVFDLTCKD